MNISPPIAHPSPSRDDFFPQLLDTTVTQAIPTKPETPDDYSHIVREEQNWRVSMLAYYTLYSFTVF